MLPQVTGLHQTAQDATGTSFAWTFVAEADEYDLTVDGVDAGSVGSPGAEIPASAAPAGAHTLGVTPFANPTPPTTIAFTVPVPLQPPLPPVGLAVTEITDTTAHVTCGASAGATDYGLQVDGAWLANQQFPVWDLEGLAPGSPHVVAVDAANSAGSSAPSSPVPFDTPPAPTAPPTPGGLRVDSVTQTSAVASCVAVPNADTYGLQVDGVLLPQQAAPTWPLTELMPDTEYSLVVDASNAIGTSDPSPPFTFTTANPVSPPPPASSSLPLVLAGAGVGFLALLAAIVKGKRPAGR